MANNVTQEHVTWAINRIQAVARRRVSFAVWSDARDYMKARGIDIDDIKEALKECTWVYSQVIGSVTRYRVQGIDTDKRTILILLVLEDELSIIEVIDVEL